MSQWVRAGRERLCLLPALPARHCRAGSRVGLLLALCEEYRCPESKESDMLDMWGGRVHDWTWLDDVFEVHSRNIQGRRQRRMRSMPTRVSKCDSRLDGVRAVPERHVHGGQRVCVLPQMSSRTIQGRRQCRVSSLPSRLCQRRGGRDHVPTLSNRELHGKDCWGTDRRGVDLHAL